MARLSDQERFDATRLAILAMEARGRMPPGMSWQALLDRWGRDDLTPSLLKDILEEDLCVRGCRRRWPEWYAAFAARRQTHTLTAEARPRMLAALQAQKLGFVLYMRILDCFPGGNASNRVLKFVLRPGGSLHLHHYANLDGTAYHTFRPFRLPTSMGRALQQRLCATLQPLVARGAPQAIEVSFDDPQRGPETAGTEWSSVEVMAFAPRSVVEPGGRDTRFPADVAFSASGWSLVQHIHQRALCRQWGSWAGEGDRGEAVVEADDDVQAVLDNAFTWLELGFPDDFDQGGLFTALGGTSGFWANQAQLPGWGMYTMPIYLRDA